MMVRLDPSDDSTARVLLELQRRAYRVEAALLGRDDIPALHEDLDTLRRCGEEFLGWREVGRLAAAISWKAVGDTLDIHRLVVEPAHFRRGLGRTLVRAVLGLPGFARVIVSTGAANLPARRLYESEGFRESALVEVRPGLEVVRFARALHDA